MASPPQQQPETSPETSPDSGPILVNVSNPPSENPSVQSTPFGSPAHSPYAISPRSSFIGSRHRATASGDSRPRSINHVKFSVGPRVLDDDDDDDAPVPPKSSGSLSSVAPAAVTGVGASVGHHARHSTGKMSSQPPSPAAFSLMSTGRSIVSGDHSPPGEFGGRPVTTPVDESRERLVQGSTTPPIPPEVPEDEFELDEAQGHKKNALGKAQERARKLASMMHKPTLQRRRLGTESFRLPNLPKIGRQDIQSAPPVQTHPPKDPFTASVTTTPENEEEIDYTEKLAKHRSQSAKTTEAHNLVKHLTRSDLEPLTRVHRHHDAPQTPYEEQGEDYVERPKQYRG
ncbi:hypothetical protein KEM56_004437, partial [Ascosphaera pollenicola]